MLLLIIVIFVTKNYVVIVFIAPDIKFSVIINRC